jgi:hypothetical protein
VNNWVIDYRLAQMDYEDRLLKSERVRQLSSYLGTGKWSPTLKLVLWAVISFFYLW